ncbi:MAG: rhamnogalacturonan acetylesterase [Sedimentisphaerales bacterium]|nr:rhamnogalacturonan acetylesterase [Sedimentisphaerales bacterium]
MIGLINLLMILLLGSAPRYMFDLGSGPVAQGYAAIGPADLYNAEKGYGLEPNCLVEALVRDGSDPLRGDLITSDRPFYFSAAVPEGNYKVTVILGDKAGASETTIKAELRRLMIEKVQTSQGQLVSRSFIVNVRTPKIPGDDQVRLKGRELTTEWAAWDDKLTLEFNGPRPCVCAIEIEPVYDIPTVYLMGDSTVCDQPLEPWNSWGQMLPRFFKPELAIANHAESGESIRSSLSAGRFEKVFSGFKAGDWLFVQFGHNDMKDKDPNALSRYKSDLAWIVDQTRKRQGHCVLITSMERKAGIEQDTLAGYPDAVRQVAREKGVPLIDLHATSKVLYKALGPDLDRAFQDGTHHTNYGSYLLAKCIVQAIKDNNLAIARSIVDEFSGFDPNRPDRSDRFSIPPSPGPIGPRPAGS